jgi:membrane protease YdiL (CAAX protease family)
MILFLLFFLLALLLMVIANLGQRLAWARWITFASLAIAALMALVAGLWAVVSPPPIIAELAEPGMDFDQPGFGLWLAISGGLSLLVVLGAMAATLRRQDPALGRLFWSRPVQATAIALTVLYAGLNLAISAAITDPAVLTTLAGEVGVLELAGQYAILVTLAFLGVGLGIRRNWRGALARLGLKRIGLIELILVGAAAFGMVIVSIVMGAVVMLLFPDSLAEVESFNQGLLLTFGSPLGAIALGLLSGIGEEILYRGALQPAFGLIATSFVFALHHSQYVNPGLAAIFVIGLLLGLIRKWWGTTPAILVHALYNTVLLLFALAAAQFVSP